MICYFEFRQPSLVSAHHFLSHTIYLSRVLYRNTITLQKLFY